MSWLADWFGMGNQSTLDKILTGVNAIMATMQEVQKSLTDLQAVVDGIGAEVDKVGVETQKLQDAVKTLTDEFAAGGVTTPEVDAALSAVQASATALAAKVQAVDDLVPDA